jgi:hypothetical protein
MTNYEENQQYSNRLAGDRFFGRLQQELLFRVRERGKELWLPQPQRNVGLLKPELV